VAGSLNYCVYVMIRWTRLLPHFAAREHTCGLPRLH